MLDLGLDAYPIPTKLEEVGFFSKGWGRTMTDIVRLTAPPCLHKLAIANPDTRLSPSAQFLWSQGQSSPPNTVKELKLRDCVIIDPVFYDYVGSFEGLESFCFRRSMRELEDFDLTSLFAVLPSRYTSTLTKLSFHTYKNATTAKLAFKELKVLKELEVDWSMLLSYPYVAGKNWARKLPQSLEKLTIHDLWELSASDWHPQVVLKSYQPVVNDLISHKTAGLLGVKEFSFNAEYGSIHSEDWIEELKGIEAGIEEVELGFCNDCSPVGIRFSLDFPKIGGWTSIRSRRGLVEDGETPGV